MRSLANTISYVFHPLLMPIIGMIFYMKCVIYLQIDPKFWKFVLIVMFSCTILFPLISISIMKANKSISSVHMPTKEERRWPLLIGTFFFVLAHVLIRMATDKMPGTDGVNNIAIAGIATLMVCTLINMFYKLSIHMAAIGGLTGLLLALAPHTEINMLYFILPVIVASGLIGFARLQLSAHSAGQVIVGYVAGFITQFFLLGYLNPKPVFII